MTWPTSVSTIDSGGAPVEEAPVLYALVDATPTTTATGNYEFGNTFHFNQAHEIVGIRFWRAASSALTTRTLRLWQDTGSALVAETEATVETGGVAGYVEAYFPDPVIAEVGEVYRVYYSEPGGQFASTAAAPTDAHPEDVEYENGCYVSTLGAFPWNLLTDQNRFADPIYQVPGAGGGGPTIVSGPDDPTTDTTATFTMDPSDTYDWSVDGGTPDTETGTEINVTGLLPGRHVFEVSVGGGPISIYIWVVTVDAVGQLWPH